MILALATKQAIILLASSALHNENKMLLKVVRCGGLERWCGGGHEWFDLSEDEKSSITTTTDCTVFQGYKYVYLRWIGKIEISSLLSELRNSSHHTIQGKASNYSKEYKQRNRRYYT